LGFEVIRGDDLLGCGTDFYSGFLFGRRVDYSHSLNRLVEGRIVDLWIHNDRFQRRTGRSAGRRIIHDPRYIDPTFFNKNNIIVIADQFINLLLYRFNRPRSFRMPFVIPSCIVLLRCLLPLCRRS
jgi:hypothetical protein